MGTPKTKGRGKAARFILANVGYKGDDCLIWPFSRDSFVGRGRLGYLGKMWWAHRLMCVLAHGKPPADKPQTAHSCGKGHLGCVNPRHLSWSNQSDNHKDRRKHGTAKTGKGSRTKLTPKQVAQIRALKGKQPQLTTARQFGISHSAVRWWQKSTHTPAPPGTSYTTIRRRILRAKLHHG